MSNFSYIPLGYKIPSQIPLDAKTYIQNETLLSDLGLNNQLAFTYYKGLLINCIDENTKYEWNEVTIENDGTGLLDNNFQYPSNHIVFGIDYSDKQYNFFKVTDIIVPTVNDATNLVKGILKLTGDLAGTADSPTVPALNNKLNKDFSTFTNANLPLTGTELIAINQGGVEKKLPVSEIKNNTLFSTQEFLYTGGVQDFFTTNPIVQILLVERNGKGRVSYINTTTKVTITSTLAINDEITIVYASEPIGLNPFYTKAEINADFVKTVDSLMKGVKATIEANNLDFNVTPTTPNIYATGVKNNYVKGKGNQINKDNNTIIGDNNQANDGGADFLLGNNLQTNKSRSFLKGNNIQSNADDDFIIGENYQSNEDDSFVIAHNNTLSNDYQFKVTKLGGVKFGELQGTGHQLFQLNSEGKALSKGNKLVYINSKQDFLDNGTKIGNTITLRTFTSYCILGNIDLTGDKLIVENSSIFSFSPTSGTLTSTGLVNDYIITAKKVCSFDRFILYGTSSQYGIQVNDSSSTIIINLFTAQNLTIGLDIIDAGNILITASSFTDAFIKYSGSFEYTSISKTIFSNSPTGVLYLIDFTSSVNCSNRIVIDNNRIVQNNPTGFHINFDNLMITGTESIQLKDNNFLGDGDGIAGINYKDIRAVFKDNKGIQNGVVIANYYNIDNVVVTDIITTNVPVKVNSSITTLAPISNKFTHTNNRVTYIGAFTKDFVINATASVTGTNGHLLQFMFAKNGVVLNETRQPINIGATNRAENVKVQGAVSLAPNDYLELWVANVNNNNDVTVTAYNVLVEAKN